MPHRSTASTLNASSVPASHLPQTFTSPPPKRWCIYDRFFSTIEMFSKFVLVPSCYFSVIHMFFLTYTLTFLTVQKAKANKRVLYLERTKEPSVWFSGWQPCPWQWVSPFNVSSMQVILRLSLKIISEDKLETIPVGGHSSVLKGKLITNQLFSFGKLHCITEMTALIIPSSTELHIHLCNVYVFKLAQRLENDLSIVWTSGCSFEDSLPLYLTGPDLTIPGVHTAEGSGQDELQCTFSQKF